MDLDAIGQKTNQDQNRVEKTYTFKKLGWDKSVTLNGYKPNYTFYLPIGQYSNPQKIVLHLKLAFSPLLNEETQVEIKFNQTLVRRVIIPANAQQELVLDMELPLTQLSPDWQALDFTARLSSAKSLCNLENWVYISPDSSVTVTSIELPFAGTLNQLTTLFISPISIDPPPLLLLTPQNPAIPELLSLFRIALQIGQMAGDSKVNLRADFINKSPDEQDKANLILIGTAEVLSKDEKLGSTISAANPNLKKALNNNAGIILLNQSPFNPLRGLLTFTGKDSTALSKAVSAFLQPEFTKIASGKEAIIDKLVLPEAIKSIDDWYQVSFRQLNYADQSVSGLGHHQLSYSIALPNDRLPVNSTVKTFITAPPFVLGAHSQVSLLVNGLKQSTMQLTKQHSAWRVDINTNIMKPGTNKLDYLIDLHFPNEQCLLLDYEQAWATIHNETEFVTSFRSILPQIMLNQLPVPFNHELAIITPDQLSALDINNLTKLAFKFGQLIQSNPISVSFYSSSEINEDFIRHNNIVLYGTNENNPWVQFAAEYLPLQLNDNARTLTLSQKQIKLSGDEATTGLLELISSPWSESRYLLLITGSNDKGITQAISKLVSDKSRVKLDGNIALINSDNSIELLKSEDIRYFSLKSQLLRKLSILSKNLYYYVMNKPQVLIYCLVFVVPAYVFIKSRRKK